MPDTGERLLKIQACPMSASVHWDPKDDSKSDIKEWYEIYNKLPYQVKIGLIDEETEQRIIEIAKKYKIYKIGELGEISRIIRDSFVTNTFSAGIVQKRIIQKLKANEAQAKELFIELIQLRGEIASVDEDEMELKTEKLPIITALKKFPKLNEQQLSERKIKIQGDDKFRKSTIKNWLDDYTLQKGAQSHNNLERSDYVFNSENVNRLSFHEKRALSLILESYDEDTDLNININKKEVLFNALDDESMEVLREGLQKKENPTENKEVLKSGILGDFPVSGIEGVKIEKKVKKENIVKKDDIEERGQSKHIVNLKDI